MIIYTVLILHIMILHVGSLSEVVNFDVDLMDSSVLSSVLYSYCPFLRHSHFSRLFVEPSTPEQCAHNAIIVISALRYIGINYNVQQNDICSPNPIFMILLSAHLYFVLPAYKPVDSIKFSTSLTKSDEVKVSKNSWFYTFSYDLYLLMDCNIRSLFIGYSHIAVTGLTFDLKLLSPTLCSIWAPCIYCRINKQYDSQLF